MDENSCLTVLTNRYVRYKFNDDREKAGFNFHHLNNGTYAFGGYKDLYELNKHNYSINCIAALNRRDFKLLKRYFPPKSYYGYLILLDSLIFICIRLFIPGLIYIFMRERSLRWISTSNNDIRQYISDAIGISNSRSLEYLCLDEELPALMKPADRLHYALSKVIEIFGWKPRNALIGDILNMYNRTGNIPVFEILIPISMRAGNTEAIDILTDYKLKNIRDLESGTK